MKACVLAAGWLVLTLTAQPAGAAVARSGQPVMGTVLTVTVIAEDRDRAQAMADAAIEEARRWDDALTIWRPDGELARLNAKAGQGAVAVSPRLQLGLAAMLELAAATEGAFDPSVGSLASSNVRLPVPLAGIGHVLHLVGARAGLNAGSALDPGAIGKGLALDAIAGLLRAGGATAAFVDFGGSSQTAFGVPPHDSKGWPVLISGLGRGAELARIRLRDASLSTSRAGAGDTTPILDPRTGAAVPAPRLVTVEAVDATRADAWSTALVVLGRDGVERAAGLGIESLMEDAVGVVRSPGFPRDNAPGATPRSSTLGR